CITIKHLLSHTSGYRGVNVAFPEVASYYSWGKLIQHLQANPLLYEPGTVFSYEHTACAIVGEILRRTTNREASQLFAERIFQPLGLSTGTILGDCENPQAYVAEHRLDGAAGRHVRLRTAPFGKFWAPSLSDLTLTPRELLVFVEAIASLGNSGP